MLATSTRRQSTGSPGRYGCATGTRVTSGAERRRSPSLYLSRVHTRRWVTEPRLIMFVRVSELDDDGDILAGWDGFVVVF